MTVTTGWHPVNPCCCGIDFPTWYVVHRPMWDAATISMLMMSDRFQREACENCRASARRLVHVRECEPVRR